MVAKFGSCCWNVVVSGLAARPGFPSDANACAAEMGVTDASSIDRGSMERVAVVGMNPQAVGLQFVE